MIGRYPIFLVEVKKNGVCATFDRCKTMTSKVVLVVILSDFHKKAPLAAVCNRTMVKYVQL